MNALSVPSAVQDITLLINIEGKWTLPDESNSTNSILTIPNFSPRHNGVYKFFIYNWDDVEVCAIQIDLTTTTDTTGLLDQASQPFYYHNLHSVCRSVFRNLRLSDPLGSILRFWGPHWLRMRTRSARAYYITKLTLIMIIVAKIRHFKIYRWLAHQSMAQLNIEKH